MAEYISREAAIAYIREQSEEWQKAFEELGGESGIYADAYNDLADNFYSIPAADVAPVVRCVDCKYATQAKWNKKGYRICPASHMEITDDDFCSYGERKEETNG